MRTKFLRPTTTVLPALALLLLLGETTGAAPADPPTPKHLRSKNTRTATANPDSPLLAPSTAVDGTESEGPFSRAGSGTAERALGPPTGNSNILHRQALKKLIAGNVAGALSDFDLAIRISPYDSALYTDRGFARQRAEDAKGALADWNRAIELDPRNAVAYTNRGSARLDQGDTAGGNADLSRAIELDPRSANGYMQRANAENVQRDFMNAWADYRSACDHSDHPPDYAQLAICLIRVRIGERAAAGELLANYFKENGRTPANQWTTQIADYLLGKLPEAGLLAAATPPEAGAAETKPSTGNLCEAWYYIGMKKLLNRDNDGAATAFRACVATGQKWYVEYQFAETELKNLPGGG